MSLEASGGRLVAGDHPGPSAEVQRGRTWAQGHCDTRHLLLVQAATVAVHAGTSWPGEPDGYKHVHEQER